MPLWKAIEAAGQPLGLQLCGLGARDTLRTEMKFPLYGNDISAETNPLEAGLGWVVKLDKPGNFVGKTALQKIKAEGPRRALVGLKVLDRGIARQGYEVLDEEGRENVGVVTSGTLSPSLGFPVTIAYVNQAVKAVGTKLKVKVRDKTYPAEVVKTPFYQRPSAQ